MFAISFTHFVISLHQALSVIDMHDAGRSQARHLDCIFQRNASFQHDGAECTFDRRFSFACISDDVILEHHSPVVNPPLWSQHFAIDDLSSPPVLLLNIYAKTGLEVNR